MEGLLQLEGIDLRGLKGSYIRFLTKNDLQRIHLCSLEVLERTGIQVFEDETLRLLEKNGCESNRGKNIVRVPRYLVKDATDKAPSTVTLCGRIKKFDLRIGDGKVYICYNGNLPYILDLETGRRRKPTREDLKNSTRVGDALSSIHVISVPLVIPADVPEKLVDLYAVEAALGSTEKHMYTTCHNEELIDNVLEMAITVAGGGEELRKRPIVSCMQQPAAPLMQTKPQLKLLRAYAQKGLPVIINPHPIAGLTAPASLAGELVVANAEALSSLVIARLINPKTPVIYGTVASTPNMRTGMNLQGSVECGLLGAGFVQLAKFCGLPAAATSGVDSKIPDAQAATERILTAMPAILAGADLIHLLEIDSEDTFSYEQLIIDDEILCMIERILAGIDVNDETLAVDLINEVGPGGTFLSKKHTMEYFEKEHYYPRLAGRETREMWEQAKSKDLRQRARDKAYTILEEHHPEPLEKSTQDRLIQILKEAEI